LRGVSSKVIYLEGERVDFIKKKKRKRGGWNLEYFRIVFLNSKGTRNMLV
jgi:hypothetical protein